MIDVREYRPKPDIELRGTFEPISMNSFELNERFHQLTAVDRLLVCYEARHRYEEGILQGVAGLRYDWARKEHIGA